MAWIKMRFTALLFINICVHDGIYIHILYSCYLYWGRTWVGLTGWIQTASCISPNLWGCCVGGMTLAPSWCQLIVVHFQPHRRQDSKQSWADSIPRPRMWSYPLWLQTRHLVLSSSQGTSQCQCPCQGTCVTWYPCTNPHSSCLHL